MDRGRYCTLLIGIAGLSIFGGTINAQTPASPVPSVSVPPSAPAASATPDPAVVRKRALEKTMVERRQRDLAVSEQEAQRRIEGERELIAGRSEARAPTRRCSPMAGENRVCGGPSKDSPPLPGH